MMDSPFSLLIYAIVAVALLGVSYGVYLNIFPPENLTTELKGGLEIANTTEFLGKYYSLGQKIIPGGSILTKDFFDTQTMSIAMECTSETKCCPKGEACSKSIEWDYGNMNFKYNVSAELSVRCIRYDGTPVCRFYFVDLPAQAKINSIELSEQNGKKIEMSIKVENIGEQKLTIGQLTPILYKDVKGDWANTEKEFESEQLQSLDPNEEYTFVWEFNFDTIGKYLVEFKFEGSNAGYDTKQIELNVTNSNLCKVDAGNSETNIMVDSEKFMEVHYCTGCDTAYECLSAWNHEFPNIEYDLLTKDSVYCVKDNYEDVCG
jgi:hypothetical protein